MVTSFRSGLSLRLLENFQREPAVQLHARRAKQRANGSRGAALLADDLAQVAGRNFQLQHRDLLALHLANGDFVGQINQSLRDVFNKLFHFQVCLMLV